MRIEVDLTDNEARVLKSLLESQDFDCYGFEGEDLVDVSNACNKVTNAIDEREVNAN